MQEIVVPQDRRQMDGAGRGRDGPGPCVVEIVDDRRGTKPDQ